MEDFELWVDSLIDWGADPNAAIKRLLGDEELFVSLFKALMESSDWDRLRALIDSGEYKESFVLAHRLKGSAADLSLGPLYDRLSDVTDDLRGDEISPGLARDARLLFEAKASLHEFLPG